MSGWRRYLWLLFLPAALAVLPHFLGPYHLHLAIFFILFGALALSWDIVVRTGMLSLAHIGFYGIGAYAAALSFHRLGLHPLLSLLFAAAVACAFAWLLGVITLRLHGLYFAIATLAFSEVMRTVTLQWKSLTGGAIGITVPAIFDGDRVATYYLVLSVLAAVVVVSLVLQRRKFRVTLDALRDKPEVAALLGVDVVRYKIAVFVLTAAFPAVLGGIYINYISYIVPYEAFSFHIAVAALVMSVFGGLNSTAGPLLGAGILKLLEEYLKTAFPYGYQIAYGFILVLVILFMPQGLLGVLQGVAAGSAKYRQIFRRADRR